MKNTMIKAVVTFLMWSVSTPLWAASVLLYFPADYTPATGAPATITQVADFRPICNDATDIYEPRLPGLDQARGYSGGATCPDSSVTGRLSDQADYVFLVDDTAELSEYLKAQLRVKSALQNIGGREVVKPTVIRFNSSSGTQGFTVLTVGEIAYRGAANSTAWLAALEQRFADDEVIAGGAAGGGDAIWVAYHGSFYNKRMELLEDVSLEKIAKYFEAKWAQVTEFLQDQGSGVAAPPVTGGSTPGPATPAMPTRSMNAYMRECAEQSVPLPPPWDPQGNQWQRQNVQTTLFVSANMTTEVWKYRSATPAGTCMALPRMQGGTDINTDIQLLGIICQSDTTGAACFWDNVERPAGGVDSGQPETTVAEIRARRPSGRARYTGQRLIGLDPIDMSDGYNLEENCTNCHRGDNVFLIHPGTAIDAGDTDHSATIYTPISGQPTSPLWRNPTHNWTGSQISGCSNGGCHSMPEPTFEYCTLLRAAIGTTMPYGSPGSWRTSHQAEVEALANLCCNLSQCNTDTQTLDFLNLKNAATAGQCLNTSTTQTCTVP